MVRLVNISVDFGTFTGGSVISNTPGNPADAVIMLVSSAATAGYHTITVKGVDNGTPADSTTQSITIYVDSVTANLNPQILGDTVDCANTTLELDSAFTYDAYLWSDVPHDSTIYIDSSGQYFVTVEKNGCFATEVVNVTITGDPVPVLAGVAFACPNDSTLISIDSTSTNLPYDSLDWGMGMGTSTSAYLTPGSHSLTVIDTNGCSASINFSILSSTPINLINSTISLCDTLSMAFPPGANTGEIGGNWTYTGPTGATATFTPWERSLPDHLSQRLRYIQLHLYRPLWRYGYGYSGIWCCTQSGADGHFLLCRDFPALRARSGCE